MVNTVRLSIDGLKHRSSTSSCLLIRSFGDNAFDFSATGDERKLRVFVWGGGGEKRVQVGYRVNCVFIGAYDKRILIYIYKNLYVSFLRRSLAGEFYSKARFKKRSKYRYTSCIHDGPVEESDPPICIAVMQVSRWYIDSTLSVSLTLALNIQQQVRDDGISSRRRRP